MTVLEKFEYLVKSYGMNEHKTLAKFHVHFALMKKMREGYAPQPNDVKKLCKILNFDVSDFLDPSSSIAGKLKDGEHVIKKATEQDVPNYVVSEDYPHEDNSRYEEKD